jgi:hypothetical protein
MSELLSGVLTFIVRAIILALDVTASISDAKRFARWLPAAARLS